MRNYFGFDMKGGKVFLPFLAGWAFLAVLSVLFIWLIGPYVSPDPLLDLRFFVGLGYCMLFFAVTLTTRLIVVYYFVKATVEAVSISGERVETSYETSSYIRLSIKGVLLTTITFGIYLPWLAASVVRYFASETSFRSNYLEFRGKASMLFIYMALFVTAPVFVIMSVLATIYTSVLEGAFGAILLYAGLCLILLLSISVYRASAIKWFINFSYGEHRKVVSASHGWNGGVFLLGQYLLCFLTFGLYFPMAILRIWRYYVRSLAFGGDTVEGRFGFTMRPWVDYLTILGQALLVAVTAGIYYPWAYSRIMELLISQSYLETVEDRVPVIMPEDYC